MNRRHEHIDRVVITGLRDDDSIAKAREWCGVNGYRIASQGLSVVAKGIDWPYRIVGEKQEGGGV